jgi:hypothetical protein
MPHYRPVQRYPLLPGGPPADGPPPGYRPMPTERPADDPSLLGGLPVPGYPPAPGYLPAPGRPPERDHVPVPDHLPAPDYPPVPEYLSSAGHRPTRGHPAIPGYPPTPDYPAVPHYFSVRTHLPVPDWPAPPVPGLRAWRQRLARLAARKPRATADRRAALAYLTVPLFVLPLLIYLTMLRGPHRARCHAAQALNVGFTGLLYDLSAVIMGAMLALDSPWAALIVFAPLVAARWLVTLAFLVRAARAAGRGAGYTFPAWLCMRIAR